MSFMKPKTKLASLLAFLPAFITKAWFVVIMVIIVFAVGGVICYGLYKIATQNLPPNSGATNNSTTEGFWYSNNSDNNISSEPQTIQTLSQTQQISQSQPFILQYGVSSSNGCPWIYAGTNMAQSITNTGNGMVYTFENDSNWFDFVYEIGGQLIRVTMNSQDGTFTNSGQCVVIESTHNFKLWMPIFTNDNCQLDWVNTFTDMSTNMHTFYRSVYY